jgi:hypothetical protein
MIFCHSGPQVAWGENNGVGQANRSECKDGKSNQTKIKITIIYLKYKFLKEKKFSPFL